ncbi:PHP domain-containing protein [Salinithrix halophila]
MRILDGLEPGTFDLHLHTTASDGALPPADLVRKAKAAGLSTIAVTDHDTLAGVEEAIKTGQEIGVHVIPGVELSTRLQRTNIDILGYHIQERQQLHDELAAFRDDRKTRAIAIIERFNHLGMPLTLEDVRSFSGDGVIARPHIAQAIVQKGYLPNVQTVFDQYLADGKPAAIEKKVLTPENGIRMIRRAGGIAVLAHPALIGDDGIVRRVLEVGLDGIEVWHRKHTRKDARRYLRLAAEFDLLVTGGSDFHNDEHTLGAPI